jgi:hypothetical protein
MTVLHYWLIQVDMKNTSQLNIMIWKTIPYLTPLSPFTQVHCFMWFILLHSNLQCCKALKKKCDITIAGGPNVIVLINIRDYIENKPSGSVLTSNNCLLSRELATEKYFQISCGTRALCAIWSHLGHTNSLWERVLKTIKVRFLF